MQYDVNNYIELKNDHQPDTKNNSHKSILQPSSLSKNSNFTEINQIVDQKFNRDYVNEIQNLETNQNKQIDTINKTKI